MKAEYIGLIAGVLTSSSLLPQLIKLVKEKKAEDVSVVMLIILMTGIGFWIYYGIIREDEPIIYTNSFSLLLNISVLILAIKYKRKGLLQSSKTNT